MGNRGGNSSEPLASSPTLYIRPRPPLRLSLPESFPQQAFSLSTYLITFRLPPSLNLFLHLSSRSNQSPHLIQNAFLLFRLFRRRRRRPQARRPSPADSREGSRPVSHQDWRCQVHLQSHGPPLAVSPQPQPAPPRPARADKVIQRAGTLFGLLGILRRNLVPSGERCQQLRLQQVDGLDRLSTGPQETMRGNPGNKKMAGPRPPFRLSTKVHRTELRRPHCQRESRKTKGPRSTSGRRENEWIYVEGGECSTPHLRVLESPPSSPPIPGLLHRHISASGVLIPSPYFVLVVSHLGGGRVAGGLAYFSHIIIIITEQGKGTSYFPMRVTEYPFVHHRLGWGREEGNGAFWGGRRAQSIFQIQITIIHMRVPCILLE